MRIRPSEPVVLCAAAVIGLVISGIGPHDRLTWLLEVSWVIAGIPVLLFTRERFPLTPLLYRLLFVHALILIVGGHYTYEHVPPGNWVRDWLDLERNNYDRLGHVAQGFIPAILVREILLRSSPLRAGKWLLVIVTSICLAFSAFFEMLEWWVAVLGGEAADAYLATQGDVWDTQWDMFCALSGAIVSQALLSRWHDRQLARLDAPATRPDVRS